jgi:hypothetical protein
MGNRALSGTGNGGGGFRGVNLICIDPVANAHGDVIIAHHGPLLTHGRQQQPPLAVWHRCQRRLLRRQHRRHCRRFRSEGGGDLRNEAARPAAQPCR